MNQHIIFHRADMDGLFSGAVCYHFLKASGNVVLHGWDYGDPVPKIPKEDSIFLVDLSIDSLMDRKHLFWIDHHKSAIDKYDSDIMGLRVDGVAACRLCWQYFTATDGSEDSLPAYRDRKVTEPRVLTLVGEYDIWDKRDPDAEALQFGLNCRDQLTVELAESLFFGEFGRTADQLLDGLIKDGRVAQGWMRNFATTVSRERGYLVQFAGLRFWCLASVHARSSLWFPDGTVPAMADALMCWRYEGDEKFNVSLYHKPGREDLDLSEIAVQYGGGGHRGACGFEIGLAQGMAEGIMLGVDR